MKKRFEFLFLFVLFNFILIFLSFLGLLHFPTPVAIQLFYPGVTVVSIVLSAYLSYVAVRRESPRLKKSDKSRRITELPPVSPVNNPRNYFPENIQSLALRKREKTKERPKPLQEY